MPLDAGMTMLCVTDEMGFAREVADRMAMFDEGQLVEINTPSHILRTPPKTARSCFWIRFCRWVDCRNLPENAGRAAGSR